ncbi:RidA family protein [Psychrobium sp. 1_MG-2023]|uniref:RidA family protein n=1 Tax=Psychrobium sp. 1_MG-2023 TaxID=3062624 RepID=UPI000C34E971|nr:RidA family protein [Psychrobium sp. 1_MG-2023]MDP2562832.1 RidA family protein [Psychrobium sp. 1_MG-2023]PKF57949.1 reactive intermediate/imine deaminase [Alteromonadales bacterium alter-6D02]
MANKEIISTDNAPQAIGTYSQAVKVDNTVYLSGQIPLVPATMEMVSEDFAEQVVQVFENLKSVCEASGGSINDIVKLNIFMTDLNNFATVNEIMAKYFSQPYPARAALGVRALPKGSQVEMDGVMVL